MDLSSVIARNTQLGGGVLIHGALAEKNGIGVIMAASGGTGKTTASHRLSTPWRSLCDDTSLVLRDSHGKYWAHPWPTWSRFLWGGPGGSWEVENAVPLKGIFCLSRALEDSTEPAGAGKAVSLLMEHIKDASFFMYWDADKEEARIIRLEQFKNLRYLIRAIPVNILHISLTGAFWHEMEEALEGGLKIRSLLK